MRQPAESTTEPLTSSSRDVAPAKCTRMSLRPVQGAGDRERGPDQAPGERVVRDRDGLGRSGRGHPGAPVIISVRDPRTAAHAGIAVRRHIAQLRRDRREAPPGVARLADLLLAEAGVDDGMMTCAERRRRQLAASSARYRARSAARSCRCASRGRYRPGGPANLKAHLAPWVTASGASPQAAGRRATP